MSSFRRTALGEILQALPPAIRWLMVINVAVWLVELVIFSVGWEPGQIVILRWLALNQPFPWVWQLVTYAFLHDPVGLLHVLFNMFMLWMFGRELEARWGSGNFLQFYLICAVGAGLCHAAVMGLLPDGGVRAPVVGASGAIMGLFAAYGILFPNRQLLIFLVLPMKAKHAVLLFAALDLIFAWQPSHGVANLAHLGGMLTAWLYLKHAWRLLRVSPLAWAKAKLDGARTARRRGRFQVVDDKEWDEWLERELDDETRH